MSKPQINVTPLIDVLLVLLIIFMVVTPMKPSSFDAKIPSEPDPSRIVDLHPWTLVVSVSGDSSLRLNNEALGNVNEPEVLIVRLSGVFKQRTENMAFVEDSGSSPRIERTVFIKAPKATDYGTVAKVVDAVKQAGADPVSLQIDNLD